MWNSLRVKNVELCSQKFASLHRHVDEGFVNKGRSALGHIFFSRIGRPIHETKTKYGLVRIGPKRQMMTLRVRWSSRAIFQDIRIKVGTYFATEGCQPVKVGNRYYQQRMPICWLYLAFSWQLISFWSLISFNQNFHPVHIFLLSKAGWI